jgi:hypothetical protein
MLLMLPNNLFAVLQRGKGKVTAYMNSVKKKMSLEMNFYFFLLGIKYSVLVVGMQSPKKWKNVV